MISGYRRIVNEILTVQGYCPG